MEHCLASVMRPQTYRPGTNIGKRKQIGGFPSPEAKTCHTRLLSSYVQGPPRLCTVVSSPFPCVAELPSRQGLRSSCSDCLVQPPLHRSTVGSRAYQVAGPLVWNCLPPEVTSAPSLTTFRTRLETFLFTESYPDFRLI